MSKESQEGIPIPPAGNFLELLEKSKTMPLVDVTREELVELLIKHGYPSRQAKFEGDSCDRLKSRIMIDGKMVGIKGSGA